jgi:molecular chaperone DnaK
MREDALEQTLREIDNEGMVSQAADLAQAAATDKDAHTHLDRHLLNLQAKIDTVENAMEWPKLLKRGQESKADARRVADQYGTAKDKDKCRQLEEELERAIDAHDVDLVKRCADDFDLLWVEVCDRQPGFHVGRLEWLKEQKSTMRDQSLADQLIQQGVRALNNNDIDGLKAANRQLIGLLPANKQEEANDPRVGTINMR